MLYVQLDRAKKRVNALDADVERFKGLTDVEAEIAKRRSSFEAETATLSSRLVGARQELDSEARNLREIQASIANLRSELASLEETADLRNFGFYKPLYNFQDSSTYNLEIEAVRLQQKYLIQSKLAATCSTPWHVNGSAAEGQKSIDQSLRLMLRAFNGECDAAMAKIRYNNAAAMIGRIGKSYQAINKLGEVQTCRISVEYFESKMKELQLVHEYQEKLQEEKEEQRRIREQMREEEIALREIEKAREMAEKEESRYATMLQKARVDAEKAVGEKQTKLQEQVAKLEALLVEAQQMKQRAISRAQMTKSGHVYVISNIGSFGENVYKIGMTRRLEPLDRVRELGDASVPFPFDVHAIIYSDDAPSLENYLHRQFTHRKVNMINGRREFFQVGLNEIVKVVEEKHGRVFNFTIQPEAKEYRQTLAIRSGSASEGDFKPDASAAFDLEEDAPEAPLTTPTPSVIHL